MSHPNFVTLSDCPTGTTWDGLTECSMESDGTAFSDPLELIVMEFSDETGAVGLTLSSADDEITIDDADAWEFTVLPVESMDLVPGLWSWNIRTTDSASREKQYVSGIIQII